MSVARATTVALVAVVAGIATTRGATPAFRSPTRAPTDEIALNDNLARAGTLDGTTLTLALEIREGNWHPLGVDKPGVRALAFAERGRPAQNPGPYIRVRTGTTIRATVSNTSKTTLAVHGLASRDRVPSDSLVLAPGAERSVEFEAGPAGTFYYWASAPGTKFKRRAAWDSQLNGAIVVDSANAPARPIDRVFVMATWAPDTTDAGVPIVLNALFTINGRPWPYTERLHFTAGDTVRWRLVNASIDLHPLHLHGFYFRVDARGDSLVDTVFARGDRRMVVTEAVTAGSTMSMTWSPDRPGNWAFHCHLNGHVTPNPVIGDARPSPGERLALYQRGEPMTMAMDHAMTGMGGLMMAISVKPKKEGVRVADAKRQLRLFVQSDSTTVGRSGRFAYVLQEGAQPPARDSVPRASSVIVLHRGEPTSIRVLNRSPEATTVHWHGLELESYYDGVAGLSGTRNHLAPMIAPGDSFLVRITPPRAGTFMYHTHVDDLRQMARGLFAPLLVIEPGESYHPESDHLFVISNDTIKVGNSDLLNGSHAPPPMTMRAGVPQRLRFLMIAVQGSSDFIRVVHGDATVTWTTVAKDGYTLPPSQVRTEPALKLIRVGETFDARAVFATPGTYAVQLMGAGDSVISRQEIRVVP